MMLRSRARRPGGIRDLLQRAARCSTRAPGGQALPRSACGRASCSSSC
jgi:hypothetical protein